jgi:hypothetical protein
MLAGEPVIDTLETVTVGAGGAGDSEPQATKDKVAIRVATNVLDLISASTELGK